MSATEHLQELVPDRFEPLVSGKQFGQFLSVGALGAGADTAVLTGSSLLLGLPDLWAKAAGIEVAILVMFLVNERWTFTDQGSGGPGPFLRRLGRSHLVRTGGVTVQLVVFWALVRIYRLPLVVAGTDVWFVVASLVSIAVATSLNYVLESTFTWQVHSTDGIESGDR